MSTAAKAFPIQEALAQRQLSSGGWSFFGSNQATMEATCLAAIALGPTPDPNTTSAYRFLLASQLSDGSWPAFQGDLEGSWTTALAICALTGLNDASVARDKALQWLIEERGKEGHWFWRWKFKTVDRSVRFDPDKYGWPWSPGAASWTIPTAFSVVALKKFRACNRSQGSEQRIRLGVEMLLDRGCAGGGWNAGNSEVYGVPLRPHVEATAIALLALQDEERSPVIHAGIEWLKGRSASIRSVESLAWCILSLFVYQEPVEQLKSALAVKLCESITASALLSCSTGSR